MDVLILPGLDGTGALHERVCDELQALGIPARSLSYPTQEFLGYTELVEFIRPLLPNDRPFVLLGESFSGPVAIALAAACPPHLVGLVLSTTFARSPIAMLRPFAPLTRFAPASLPSVLVSWSLLGPWTTPELVRNVQSSLALVAPAVVRGRAAAALGVDVCKLLPKISVPVLQLRAKQDRLLSAAAQGELAAGLRSARQVELAGPHLLLQAQPQASANAIAQFVSGLAS